MGGNKIVLRVADSACFDRVSQGHFPRVTGDVVVLLFLIFSGDDLSIESVQVVSILGGHFKAAMIFFAIITPENCDFLR